MAFPDTPLGAQVELQAGGVWTDVTADAYTRDPITITRGQPDGAWIADPSRCTVTLNNKDGKYSPRNPMSPYYGQIGRNTPLRVSVTGATPGLYVPEGSSGRATTPDHASLDITGDIDIRVDVAPHLWSGAGNGYELIGKYNNTGDQRSWRFIVTGEGELMLTWSPTGTSTVLEHRSQLINASRQRQTVRATLDVNNGAGGYTLTYYIGPSLAGPWTQIGQTVTSSGTTSIFSSTALLEVGDIASMAYTNHARRIYAIEVRSGIDGPIVAAPSFTTQPLGTTSFADSTGKTWTVTAGASITDRDFRFVGEASSWPPRWAPSGEDVWTSIEGAGVLRRLNQGTKALESTLRRRLPSRSPLAYWPCEEPQGATQAYSPLPGVGTLAVSRWDFGQDDTLGGSSALPAIEPGGTMRGRVPSSASGVWEICMPYRVDGTPPAAEQEMLSWTTTGTIRRWRITMGTSGTHILGYDATGALTLDSAIGAISGFFDGWWRLEFKAEQSGGSIAYRLRWTKVGGDVFSVSGTIAGTVGAVSQIDTAFGVGLPDIRVGHIAVFSAESVGPAYADADRGFIGETAAARLRRLATEESGTVDVHFPTGYPSGTTPMGTQRPQELLTLLHECAASDLGILAEDRQSSALVYRARRTRYNQTPAMVLDYAAGDLAPPLEPVDDDADARNDRTVNRIGGSSGRAVLESGPMSVQAPPLGIGLYDDSTDLSLATDDQTQPIAEWLLHLGTWDESRVPTVQLALHKRPELIPAYLALELGDRIQIINTPSWLPPGPIDLIVQGSTETLGIRTWNVTLTCVPAGPWTVGVVDDVVLGRADTDGSQLAAGVSASATSLSVSVTAGPLWTTVGAEFPFDIVIGGEEITVTGITGASSPQSFTVTRATNGISKGHSAGADVRLAHPAIAAL
ncbi:hypothetical protein L1085_016400 [Streptomyces sp. MSC1_001]|jgi:hypothetical protein|uniref:hypothetical protein n=1 Tax=Streptomyces sp. MSC1_001 TaxID=2909263 RepID=UPI00202F38C1|nr:hypothetical protein [Streptomyces sp. MSC1_001]